MAIANKGRKLATEAPEASKQSVKPTGGKIDLKEQGKNIYHSKTAEEREFMGSKSHAVEFIALITNPYQPVSRKVKGEVIKGNETVGAIFKNIGEEPIQVLTIPNKTFNVMDGDFENVTQRDIKPGEEFQATSLEVAQLMTRDEYASRVTGGDKVVSYTTQSPKEAGAIPTTKLRIKDGSIKDYSVAIAEVSEDGKTKTMKPEFEEKFQIFSTRGTRRRGVSGSAKTPKANPAGLAIQALFNQKLGSK